jgi:hypothetical protein
MSSKYYVFVNRLLSPSGGRVYENLPHNLILVFLEARLWTLGNRLTRGDIQRYPPRAQEGSAQVDEPSPILWICRLPTDIVWHSQISGTDTPVALESEMGLSM